ncbi:MAG TPA: hypothetical protein VFT79_10620 [Solirubrobacterales bacterium]|nr:hypothetical protein [Solirubrobacterales bacterium]
MSLIGSITIGTGIFLFLVFLGGLLVRSLGGAASSVLADEFKASAPEMAQGIIRLAARLLPPDAREDMLETWLAEVSQYEKRPLKALRFALVNCLVAAPSLRKEMRPALQPAGATNRKGRISSGWEETRSAIKRARGWLSSSDFALTSLGTLINRCAAILVAALAFLAATGTKAIEELGRFGGLQLRLLNAPGRFLNQLVEGTVTFLILTKNAQRPPMIRFIRSVVLTAFGTTVAVIALALFLYLLEGPLGL